MSSTVLLGAALLAQSSSVPDYALLRERFLQVYEPVVRQASGLGLQIHLDPVYRDYFGGVDIRDGKLTIIMGSEFERKPKVTPDVYTLILCHEVGHLLGGEPRKTRRGKGLWVSTEGQSDYYAASVCLKEVFGRNPDGPGVEYPVSPRVADICAKKYPNEADRRVCRRIAYAGRAMFEYVVTLYDDFPVKPVVPEYDEPEAAGASAGYEYPSFQCRLDTFVAGAIGEARPTCGLPDSGR